MSKKKSKKPEGTKEVNRKALVSALKTCAPAISSSGGLPLFERYFFFKTFLGATNDQIAICVPFESPVLGSVASGPILAGLTTSRAASVLFAQSEGNIRMRMGRARMTLELAPLQDELFDWMEDVRSGVELPLTADLLAALKIASLTMDDDYASEWRFGVTVDMTSRRTSIYSSDNATASRAVLRDLTAKALPAHITETLTPAFVRCVLSIGVIGDVICFDPAGSGATELRTSSGCRVRASTSVAGDASNFTGLWKKVHDIKPTWIKKPAGIEAALAKSSSVRDSQEQRVSLTIDDDRLSVHAKGAFGFAMERLRLQSSYNDPECDSPTVSVRPERVLKALGYADDFCIIPKMAFGLRNTISEVLFSVDA